MEIYAKPLIQITLKELFRLQSVGYFFQISSLPLYLSTNLCFIFSFHYHYLLHSIRSRNTIRLQIKCHKCLPSSCFLENVVHIIL